MATIVPSALSWQYSPYSLPLLLTTLLSLCLSIIGWSRRSITGAAAFAILTLAVAEWSLAYALQLGALDLPTQLFFGNVEYFGIATVPVATLVFALAYTGRVRWLKPSILALLALEPLLTVVLVWTMPTRGPIRASVALDPSGPFPALVVTRGTWFWIHTA